MKIANMACLLHCCRLKVRWIGPPQLMYASSAINSLTNCKLAMFSLVSTEASQLDLTRSDVPAHHCG